MKAMLVAAAALVLAGTVAAQTAAPPPVTDTRPTVHTIVREDIFAGFLEKDMTRFARGEANVEELLKTRPNEKGSLLAWKGGAKLYRAVLAREAGDAAGYARLHGEAIPILQEALKNGTQQDGG